MTIKDPHFDREQQKYQNPIPSREYILEHLMSIDTPQNFEQIRQVLKIDDEEMIVGLKRRLRAMERDGQLLFNRNRTYQLPSKMDMVQGKVIGHRDGFGFLEIEDDSTDGFGGGEDWYIPAHEMKKLIPGDRILAKSHKIGFKNKPEASLVKVLETRIEPIVGRYYIDGGMGLVVPEDARIAQDIMIHPGQESGARVNQIVAVELTQRPTHRVNAMGRITEVMGDYMDPGMEIEIALRNHDIPHVWPEEVEKQIQQFGDIVPKSAKQGRVDLTKLPLVTIDGEDARDFDDAVYCETKRGGGWRLWVAIADVSSYVTKGSPLDKEALNRGTSVYFPENVIPMLPKVLSNGLCSLNPKVDRLCLVCEMTISARGKLSGYKFYEAVMNSAQRFTYTQVAAILDGDEKLRAEHHDKVEHLQTLHDLYNTLYATRQTRGAIEFETVETRFVFNAQRKIDHIIPVHRNDAHKIIEECMILANVSAAKFITKHKAHGLFRVHDTPDEAKLSNFRGFLGELGIVTKLPLDPEPFELTAELTRLADRDDIELIQIMLLRSMKQAVYQVENHGHFGLALKEYAHFTSPIRRYPDLLVHRTIKGILSKEGAKPHGHHLYEIDEAEAIGLQCSMAERRADDATREVSDWLKCEYMQDHIGQQFEGVIASVTNFGFFVRIDDLYVDGLVHVSSLRGDYYHYDATRHTLIGEASRKVYRMGDSVHVQVAAVNLEQRKIDFVLADSISGGKRRAGRRGGANQAKLSPAKASQAIDDEPMSVREQLARGLISEKGQTEQGSLGKNDKRQTRSAYNIRRGSDEKNAGKGGKGTGKKADKPSMSNSKKGKKKTVKKKRPGKNARRRAKLQS